MTGGFRAGAGVHLHPDTMRSTSDESTVSPRAPEATAQSGGEPMAEFRRRAYVALGFATVPFLLPFAVASFVEGRTGLGAVILVVTAFGLLNRLSIHRGGRFLLPYRALYFIILGVVLWGIATIWPMVAFWAYPVVIVTLVVSDRRQARWLVGSGAALLALAALAWMTTATAARFAMTFGLTWYFGDLVVSLLAEQEARLTTLAPVDPLTGAFNRRHMSAQLSHAIEQQKRGMGEVSLIVVDIDDFKKINDEHGHAVGDKVLSGVVGMLQRRIRKVDSVFRTGGEEFLVLARNIASKQVGVIAESLRAHVEESDLLDGEMVTVSVGVAHYDGSEDAEACVRRADANLYEAKRRGRNRVWPACTDARPATDSDATASVL